MATEVLEQQFSVGEQASLTLSNLRGSVWIGPLEENQPQNQAFVRAVKDTSSGDAKRTRVEMRQEPGGRVVVETKFNEAGGWLPAVLGLNQPCKVDYQVRLPQSCSLHVTCVSSSAEVRGLTGSFQIKSISGPLTLQDLSGQIGAKTISGRLEAENLQGSLELECISGAISLGKSQAESLRAATTSGDVFLQTPVLAGPYQIKTVSGDVEFVIPAESGLDIKFSSISGRVDSTQKLSAQRFQGGSQSYQLNGGGTRLDVHTTSGDLRLRTLGEPPRAAPEPKPGPGYSEEVLDRIERGEISVDEALQAIENGGQIESAEISVEQALEALKRQ
jgi:hypothetical protein